MTRPVPAHRAGSVASRRRGLRRGFSVVEVIVAMVLLGVALSTLGVLAFTASRRNTVVANSSYRAAAMRYLFDRYSALDYDDLDPATQSLDSTLTTGPMPYRMRAEFVTTANPNERQIRLVVTPANTIIKPETTFVRRFRWATENPLNTPNMGL
jgi:prepilin-type N-terminal cleavage/methylation domain-containing protein